MRKFLFTLLFVIFFSGFSLSAICPQGDLTHDCKVNWKDIQEFAEQWLNTVEDCPQPGCANFDSINGINLTDYSYLAANWGQTGIALVINEFMASNNSESGIADPQGEYDDWVEIYNAGPTAVDLGGMYLTDDLSDPTNFMIPAGITGNTLREEIANRLQIKIEKLNGLAKKSERSIQIGSYCTVFTATEILTKIREGVEVKDLVKGIFGSVIKRALEMDPLEGHVVMSGGVVAHNPFLVEMFEKKLGRKIFVPPLPQLTGAFGAAIYALEEKGG